MSRDSLTEAFNQAFEVYREAERRRTESRLREAAKLISEICSGEEQTRVEVEKISEGIDSLRLTD